jgi:hypothetical protein
MRKRVGEGRGGGGGGGGIKSKREHSPIGTKRVRPVVVWDGESTARPRTE